MRKASTILLIVSFIFITSGICLDEKNSDYPDDRPKKWLSNWGKWGPDDEIGALNYITPEVILEAARLIKKGKVISLAMNVAPHVSPVWPGRHGLIRSMKTSGKDFLGKRPYGNMAWTESFICIEDHGSTHIDPLCHLWWGDFIYNGYSAVENIDFVKGAIKCSSNAYIPKSFTRGVLIDVARYLNVDYVEDINGSKVLEPELIDKIAESQNVKITPGTALIIRIGWLKRWTGTPKPWTLADGHVGLSCGSEKWIQEKQIALIGCDNAGIEATPPTNECLNYYKVVSSPMHVGILSMLGVPLLELMDLEELAEDCAEDGVYEFAISFSPFKYVNATGGLVSPTAIK